MHNEFPVALTIEDKFLLFGVLLTLMLIFPLRLKHGALVAELGLFLLNFKLLRALLPIEYSHGVGNSLLFLSSLLNLALELLLGIKCVKLSIDILLKHLLLNLATLVNKLLLTLDLGTVRVELTVFAPQGVVLHFKLLVVPALHLDLALILIFGLEMCEASVHLSTNLLRCLQVVVEFLLVHFVFSCEKGGKLGAALLQVVLILFAHLIDTAINDAFNNTLVGFVFPVSAMRNIAITRQLVV